MSSGSLPPVPDLIPIALLKSPAAMGEQRPRRSGSRTSAAAESIDNSGKSRGLSAAPQPAPLQSRKRHHRKSDRRREHRKVASKTRARNSSTPPPPRVNPIFVWVRQEDTRIVDVKCEDYDKRNRILLTKTPQGWRAIPRTETLAPTLKEAADRRHHHRKHHHHRPHKDKVKKKSTAVQVDGNISNSEEPEEDVIICQSISPTWNTPVNVESHLPSHKILVPQKCPSPSVNTVVDDSAQTQTEDNQCSVPKLCDISPLDNLLAVAEFEFNQQNWSPKSTPNSISEDDQKDIINNILQSCQENSNDPTTKQAKSEECDYNEEDENNLAMDDILTRLEQSLQSPECSAEIAQVLQLEQESKEEEVEDSLPQPSIAVTEEEPTDLTFKPQLTQNNNSVDQPTDLSVPRPSSQNSEAIQSPQPSGIPAVPPSPDIITPSTKKSVFLESLLTTASQKIPLNSEVTIIKQSEPLDLGKSRESASPTVTCSEQTDIEPPAKKFKPTSQDITLKNLLDEETSKSQDKNTPRLLELLKNDSNEADPLTQLRQLLTDRSLNIPDPMLVPKEKLSLLISHPGKEIPRLLKQRPELRLPEALAFPHLLQDPDILVITLQQLETIILKQNQTLPLKDLKSYEKKLEMREPKKKEEVLQKSAKPFNELASDIDAATTAAFNQMLWLPYLSQLEAMSCAGDPQMMKLLSSPVYPPDLVHLNRLPPNVNYNPVHPPQMNYNSSLELSMWQEAMFQANVLRPKPQNNFLDFSPKPKLPPPPNKQSLPNFYPSGANSFLNMPFQSNKPGMQLPLYGHTKQHHHKSLSSHFAPKQKYAHKVEEKHRQRVACSSKPFSVAKPSSEQQHKTQPIDLSSITTPRIKVKSHPLLKHDDIPEVGSTTASVEEMQDAQKHLWHPLFGNQKGYHNPWNWTTVKATGE